MGFNLKVEPWTICKETTYDYEFDKCIVPLVTIGVDSYIIDAELNTELDEACLCCLQIGRYSSIAKNVKFIVDNNHDYMRPCQGRINGPGRLQPKPQKRKGQILIMNDCWIGEGATIMGGVVIGNGAVVAANSVVTKSVPPYAIVAGNPAKIVRYRFDNERIEKLNKIRWWNWSHEDVVARQVELYGDIDEFIEKYENNDSRDCEPINIMPITKENQGEEKIYAYFPDFEQDFPTYKRVIEQFIKKYSDTNYELLLCIPYELRQEVSKLDEIFAAYNDCNCYINLYIGDVTHKTALFCQVDGYITNRSTDNLINVDIAQKYGLEVIMSLNEPIF